MSDKKDNQIDFKSEILFLYETSYNIPNGDPFTGEQRYDEETKKILVSDVRMKRFIRTYLEEEKKLDIYVSDKTSAGKTDAKGILHFYFDKFAGKFASKNGKVEVIDVLKKLIDVRLFGGVSTLEKGKEFTGKNKIENKDIEQKYINGHVNLTGPVQYAMLNPSLNSVNLQMHQNTSHFKSTDEKTQGAIATTSLVPYSLMQIHGWVNPKVAMSTGMTNKDLELMFEGLWYGTGGVGSSHSRSKIGQDSVLLLEIIYQNSNQKIYGLDRKIKLKLKDGIKEEQIRSSEDYCLDFSEFIEIVKSTKVKKVKYYTDNSELEKLLKGEMQCTNNESGQTSNWKNKYEKMVFTSSKGKIEEK